MENANVPSTLTLEVQTIAIRERPCSGYRFPTVARQLLLLESHYFSFVSKKVLCPSVHVRQNLFSMRTPILVTRQAACIEMRTEWQPRRQSATF